MEQISQQRKMNYEEALALAKSEANEFEWMKTQILYLEGYLIKITLAKLGSNMNNRKKFLQEIKNLKDHEYTRGNLIAISKKYGVIIHPHELKELEEKSLKHFCKAKGIELIS